MNNMNGQRNNVIALPGIQGISRAAAERISDIALEAVSSRGVFHLVLSGGRTPENLYELFLKSPYNSSIPWTQSHIYWGDERCVRPESEESNYGQASRTFLTNLPVPENHIHRIKGELGPQKAADEYRQVLISQSDTDRDWPQFDLVLLGMGADGHTASLFPGPIAAEERRVSVMDVTANYEDRPSSRVTMTPLALNSTHNIIFLVVGADKAAALSAAINGPEDQVNWPVHRIRPDQGTVTWLVDHDAATKL